MRATDGRGLSCSSRPPGGSSALARMPGFSEGKGEGGAWAGEQPGGGRQRGGALSQARQSSNISAGAVA